jgi:hypothetical protein
LQNGRRPAGDLGWDVAREDGFGRQ